MIAPPTKGHILPVHPIHPPGASVAAGGYSQGIELTGATRFLFISGQVPEDTSGHVLKTFEEQAQLTWRNVIAVLNEASMEIENLVKVTTFLSDRRYRDANTAIRSEVLGQHRPALTVIITGIYEPSWLLEIEAIAAD